MKNNNDLIIELKSLIVDSIANGNYITGEETIEMLLSNLTTQKLQKLSKEYNIELDYPINASTDYNFIEHFRYFFSEEFTKKYEYPFIDDFLLYPMGGKSKSKIRFESKEDFFNKFDNIKKSDIKLMYSETFNVIDYTVGKKKDFIKLLKKQGLFQK